MLALQFAIGTINDLVDEPADRRAQPDKPLASGLTDRAEAFVILGLALAVALGCTALAGGPAVGLAICALGLGLLYDLRLKGTAASWLPFAAGVGLLPVYGWVGATGRLPPLVFLVAGLAVLGGTTLAFANALADAEPDRQAGRGSLAIRLGQPRTIAASAVLLAAIQVVAIATTVSRAGWPVWTIALEIGGGACGWLGLRLSVAPPSRRQLGWEVQAVGLAVLGAAWLAAMAATGALPRA